MIRRERSCARWASRREGPDRLLAGEDGEWATGDAEAADRRWRGECLIAVEMPLCV